MPPIDETDDVNTDVILDPLEAGDSGAVASTNLIGSKLDDYQILRRLGRGGMADVYVALHQTLERQVALKVLKRQLAGDAGYVERFRREARAAAKLNHPNIVHVYEVGRCDDLHYIAQELIDGGNLKDEVERNGPLKPEDAADVLRAVSSALAAAHQAGITHRDIKPENILRSLRNEVKVADFGLARLGTGNDLTQIGLTMGTPRYMSPEQCQGKTADARSDLYSLGCTMYFLLTGRPPFEADDALAIALQHMQETPPPLAKSRGRSDVPDWMVAMISRLMSKSPNDRYANAGEVVAAVEQCAVSSLGSSAIGGAAAATVQLQLAMRTEAARRRKRRLKILATAALPLIAIVAGAVSASNAKPPSVQRLLAPDLVPKKSTVEEQYLAAASRDDKLAWQSVSEYFPASGDAKLKNSTYAIKADLQLSRFLVQHDRKDEAKPILEKIANDPGINRLYQVIALSELIDLHGVDADESKPLMSRLNQVHKILLENQPDKERILRDVVNPEILRKLQTY